MKQLDVDRRFAQTGNWPIFSSKELNDKPSHKYHDGGKSPITPNFTLTGAGDIPALEILISSKYQSLLKHNELTPSVRRRVLEGSSLLQCDLH